MTSFMEFVHPTGLLWLFKPNIIQGRGSCRAGSQMMEGLTPTQKATIILHAWWNVLLVYCWIISWITWPPNTFWKRAPTLEVAYFFQDATDQHTNIREPESLENLKFCTKQYHCWLEAAEWRSTSPQLQQQIAGLPGKKVQHPGFLGYEWWVYSERPNGEALTTLPIFCSFLSENGVKQWEVGVVWSVSSLN